MDSNLTFENYFYNERLGKETHAMKGSYFHCVWCKKYIGLIYTGNSIVIAKDQNISYCIPYCSEKCKTEDPNSVGFIENYINICDSFKPRFIKEARYLKQINEKSKENELIKESKKQKILVIKSIILGLIILAVLYGINGMNIIGYFFALLFFLIVRSLLK